MTLDVAMLSSRGNKRRLGSSEGKCQKKSRSRENHPRKGKKRKTSRHDSEKARQNNAKHLIERQTPFTDNVTNTVQPKQKVGNNKMKEREREREEEDQNKNKNKEEEKGMEREDKTIRKQHKRRKLREP